MRGESEVRAKRRSYVNKNTSPKELCQKEHKERHAELRRGKGRRSRRRFCSSLLRQATWPGLKTNPPLPRGEPGPGRGSTRGGCEAVPARVGGQPGADARRTRGGCEKRGAKVSAGGGTPPACPRACSRVRFSPDARRPRGGASERQQPASPLPAPPSRKSDQREELCQNARGRLSAVRCPLRAQRACAHDFPLAHFGGAPYNKGAMLERAFRSRRKDSV